MYKKKKYADGTRDIFIFGVKVFSYKKEKENLSTKMPSQKNDICANVPEQKMYTNLSLSYDAYISLDFYWDTAWKEYMIDKDVFVLVNELLQDLDDVSFQYVNRFMNLLQMVPYKTHIKIQESYAWTKKDIEADNVLKNFPNEENYPKGEAFIHANSYGLSDVLAEIQLKVDGKLIIDGGAFTGDTAVLFNKLFPKSTIHSFEPQTVNYKGIQERLLNLSLDETILVYNQGLSDECGQVTMFSTGNQDAGATLQKADYTGTHEEVVEITTIDSLIADINKSVGLIKLDVEGHEKIALQGAISTIKKDKPVIVAAIYHNPVDFFEIKPFLQKLNPEYKFMIRRSEMVIPMADLVLIAY